VLVEGQVAKLHDHAISKREEMDERSFELHSVVERRAGHDRGRMALLVGEDCVDLEPAFAARPRPYFCDVAENLLVSLVLPGQRMVPGDVDIQVLGHKLYQGRTVLLCIGPIELANGCVVVRAGDGEPPDQILGQLLTLTVSQTLLTRAGCQH